jgi:ring-1,2-phenylacetyl-CoA epoxidase subunit PaaD
MVTAELRHRIEHVADPELPVVTIAELGILREVTEIDGVIEVTITPTYAGCPAMDAIRADITQTLQEHGYEHVEVRKVLSPAWTTDRITEEGKAKLLAFGIAPPAHTSESTLLQLAVTCPRCGSSRTRLVSRFGSTPCKAHRVCMSCSEPFDHFQTL